MKLRVIGLRLVENGVTHLFRRRLDDFGESIYQSRESNGKIVPLAEMNEIQRLLDAASS